MREKERERSSRVFTGEGCWNINPRGWSRLRMTRMSMMEYPSVSEGAILSQGQLSENGLKEWCQVGVGCGHAPVGLTQR